MPQLHPKLELSRCPHCSVSRPNLTQVSEFQTSDHAGTIAKYWRCYKCTNCGGVVAAWAKNQNLQVEAYFPSTPTVDEALPERPRSYLQQAIDSIHAPAGSVMLAASSVDSMLKLKGYKDGSLSSRIKEAAKSHLITEDMAKWAHEVRLDANDQRHADDTAVLPTPEDAQRAIDFTQALAQFLFVLPNKVQRGIERKQQP